MIANSATITPKRPVRLGIIVEIHNRHFSIRFSISDTDEHSSVFVGDIDLR